jgi:hypothetical protein
VCEKTVLRRISGPNRKEQGDGKICALSSCLIFLHQISVSLLNDGRLRQAGHVAHIIRNTKFWLINLKRRDYLGYLGIDGKIILKWILGKEM